MSNQAPQAKPVNPDNPYNIDFAREHRLKRIFQIAITAGFIFAVVMLIIGYTMDMMFSESDAVPSVTPYSTAAQPINQPVTAGKADQSPPAPGY